MIGSMQAPIPRTAFRDVFVKYLESHPAHYVKCTPTLVLFDDGDRAVSVPKTLPTILKHKLGQSVEEVVRGCDGKAVLLNFLTPSMEAYTKGIADCEKIYVMSDLIAVPEAEEEAVRTLQQAHQRADPICTHEVEYTDVVRHMRDLRASLGRSGSWHLAFNTLDTIVTALKLTSSVMRELLRHVGRDDADLERTYYREESFAPTYAFAKDDWVLMDRHGRDMSPKTDKEGHPIVRTVHGPSFECTYRLADFSS